MSRFAHLDHIVADMLDDRQYRCGETDIIDGMLADIGQDPRRHMLLALRIDALEPPGPDDAWLEWETHGQLTAADEYQQRIDAGATMRELAEWVGVPRSTLGAKLRAAGIRMRRRGAPRRLPSTDELIRRLGLGERPDQIGAEAGVTASAIYVQLRYYGYRMRGGRVVTEQLEAA